MEYQFKELPEKDMKTASDFAIAGMHFDQYFSNRFLLQTVGRHFFLSNLNRAAQVISAYRGDQLAGVLLAEMKGEPAYPMPWYRRAAIHLMDWLSSLYLSVL